MVLSSIIGPHQSWSTATFLEEGRRADTVVADNTCYLIPPCVLETTVSLCLSLRVWSLYKTHMTVFCFSSKQDTSNRLHFAAFKLFVQCYLTCARLLHHQSRPISSLNSIKIRACLCFMLNDQPGHEYMQPAGVHLVFIGDGLAGSLQGHNQAGCCCFTFSCHLSGLQKPVCCPATLL